VNADAVAADGFIIGAKKKMHVMADTSQFGPVIAPYRATADDSDLHRNSRKKAL
jgi:hypothetical protein